MSSHKADYGASLDYTVKTTVADGSIVTAEDAVTAGPPSLDDPDVRFMAAPARKRR